MLQRRVDRRQKSSLTPIPVPTGGIDALSPITSMRPENALVLENFIPRTGSVELRKGYYLHSATGEDTPVKSLMVWTGVSSSKMFAATNNEIFDVTTSTSASAVTSLSNDEWQHVIFTTAGGHFLWICNGEDAPRHYNGSTWATPTLNNITPETVANVNVHKGRLWLTLAGSTAFGYLPTGSIAGDVETLELGEVFSKGGYGVAMATWTRDAGSGSDDYAIFISSMGQVAVYAGDDPASASTWQLVGVYDIGQPIGRRCYYKLGGDLAIITVDGVISLAGSIEVDRLAASKITLTRNITPLMNDAVRDYGDLYGWQFIGYPKGSLAILNVPQNELSTSMQYVMNTNTGAWSKFTGIDAICWCIMGQAGDENIYFGGTDGNVYEFDRGQSDYTKRSIPYKLKTAFNYVGGKGRQKKGEMVRALIESSQDISYSIAVDVDFRSTSNVSVPTVVPQSVALWDVAQWDVDLWPNETEFKAEWTACSAIGNAFAISLYLDVSSSTQAPDYNETPEITFKVNGFDLIHQSGGLI